MGPPSFGGYGDLLQSISIFIFVQSFELQVTSYRLQVTGYKLQVTGYKLQVTSCRLQVWSYLYPIPYVPYSPYFPYTPLPCYCSIPFLTNRKQFCKFFPRIRIKKW